MVPGTWALSVDAGDRIYRAGPVQSIFWSKIIFPRSRIKPEISSCAAGGGTGRQSLWEAWGHPLLMDWQADMALEYRGLVWPDRFCFNLHRNQCYPRSSLLSSTAATSPCKPPVDTCGEQVCARAGVAQLHRHRLQVRKMRVGSL